ncbi:phage tail protein [Salmonella enterica]
MDTVNRASHVNATDGDLYGTQWGGWLSSYIRRNTPSVPSLTPYATTTWVNQNFLSGFRLGGVESAQVWRAFGYDDNPPYVITGVINGNTDDLIDSVKRRPLQMYINGWRNIDWT